jgi:predicted permease
MDEELRAHVELEVGEGLRRGLTPDQARRAAAVRFGSLDTVKEECRDASGTGLIEALVQDVRVGARSFARRPGYVLAVVLTLGLGIGANTAIFSLVRGVLLRPLTFRNGDRVVMLRQPVPSAGIQTLHFSVKELEDYRSQNRTLDSLVEYSGASFTLHFAGEAHRVQAGVVSADFFDVLGVTPQLGRSFHARDDSPGADPVVLLSHEFWRNMGADTGVVGRAFRMDDRVCTVVGVLPPLPPLPRAPADEIYVLPSASPFRARPLTIQDRGSRILLALGRLKHGVTLDQAESDLRSVLQHFRRTYPEAYEDGQEPTVSATPLREELTRDARPTFFLLLATVAFLLVLACANVANLTLARLGERSQELAVRSVLGAGRGRLLRQLTTEGILLSLVGGLVALGVAAATHGALVRFAAQFTPLAAEIRIDGSVLAFTLGVAVVVGIGIGALWALTRPVTLAPDLAAHGRATAGGRRQRVRAGLVACQVALSLVLVIGAALMLRSLAKLHGVDAGFGGKSVLTVWLELDASSYLTPERRFDLDRFVAFHEGLLDEVRGMPGVAAAGCAPAAPLSDFGWEQAFQTETRSPGSGLRSTALQMPVSVGYFEALGVKVLRGRSFVQDDLGRASDGVIINRFLAERHFAGGDAIGRRISFDGGRTWRTIVGIVSDVRHTSLDREPRETAYLPFSQFPASRSSLFVRTIGDTVSVAPAIRALVRRLDPHWSIIDVRTLAQIRESSIESPRLRTSLLGFFAALALAISATGIGGVVAYAVSQRRLEIGLRVALGARPLQVLRMVLRQGLMATALGVSVGLSGAAALSRMLSGLLFGVEPTDALSFIGAAALLVAVAVAASLIPAWRAAMSDPAAALRAE